VAVEEGDDREKRSTGSCGDWELSIPLQDDNAPLTSANASYRSPRACYGHHKGHHRGGQPWQPNQPDSNVKTSHTPVATVAVIDTPVIMPIKTSPIVTTPLVAARLVAILVC